MEIPLSEWASEFAEVMPSSIRKAVLAARGDLSGSIEDDEYRKRLQERFGDRWAVKTLVIVHGGESGRQPGTGTGERVLEFPQKSSGGHHGRKRYKVMKIPRQVAFPYGDEEAIECDVPVDVPRYEMAHADEFDQPFHLALWAPRHPEGPTVLINIDSQILQDIVKYHQEQYPEIYSEEVQKTVYRVFGEVAACKVAHAQQLTSLIAENEVNDNYRCEMALTVALMGLMAEDMVIRQRLHKSLGRKKPVGLH